MMFETRHPPLHLVILAGGLGLRARRGDAAAPKQFRAVGGEMLLLWSVRALTAGPQVASLTVAVPEPWRAVVDRELADRLAGSGVGGAPLPHHLAPAGETRTASAVNALDELALREAPSPDDLVAIHDAARPFATAHLLQRLCAAAARHGGAIPGVPVTDTVVRLEEDRDGAAAVYLERETLQAVQTPQVFRYGPLHEAHRWARQEQVAFTDDGGLLAARGLSPVVVMGERDNWKVTTESDWIRAEAILRGR